MNTSSNKETTPKANYTSEKKKIFTNIGWLIGEYAMKMLSGLLITIMIARNLGAEKYGEFQYALSLVTVFTALSFICGAEVLVPKLTSSTTTERRKIIGSAYALRLIISCIAYALLAGYALLAENETTAETTLILGTIILLNEPHGVVTAWLQAKTEIRAKAILASVTSLTKLTVVGIIFFHNINSSKAYGWTWPLESILIAIGLIFVYKRRTGDALILPDTSIMKELLREGLPFFGGLIAAYIYLRTDIILLKQYGTAHDLGAYSAATQLLTALTAFAPILVMSMAPLMVYRQEDTAIIRRNLTKMTLLVAIFAILAATLTSLLAKWIVPLLLGEEYTLTIPIVRWLSFAAIFLFIESSLNVYLIKTKKGWLISYKWVIALFIAIFFHVMLIPPFGAFGAVAGYAAGYISACIYNILCIFFIQHDSASQT